MTYRPYINDYQEAVAHAFGITPADLTDKSRAARHAVPRQCLAGLLRELTPLSLPRIGEAINRDHTTVLGAVRRFPQHEADPIYGPKIKQAREALAGGVFRTRRKETVDT